MEELSPEQKALLEKYPMLADTLADTSLSPFQKRLKMLPIFRDLREEKAKKEKRLELLRGEEQWASAMIEAHQQWNEWKTTTPVLQSNDCSRLHKVIAFQKMQYGYFLDLKEDPKSSDPNKYPWKEISCFVVQHDWAAAFKNAGDYAEGGFNLPFERCAFEFRISGRSVTVLCEQPDGEELTHTFYFEFGDAWLSPGEEGQRGEEPGNIICAFAKEQIKAICVALDAEVATRNAVRQSEKVNRKREEQGKEPFYSYHVVSLNRRYRISNPSGGGNPQGKKRLHFRRGHWRHFAEFKTWVRWTLVGNPELGFIDKEYRL